MKNEELITYLQKQIRTTDERLRRFTHDLLGKPLAKRHLFVKVKQFTNDFLLKKAGPKWIVIPGLRGVGKTTLMAQVCSELKNRNRDLKILFISLDEIRDFFNVGLKEIFAAYEELMGFDLERSKEPIFLFIDEIQNDPKWSETIKYLYEKTANVFVCCTGSSAVILQTSVNAARRAKFERMAPMCFVEYQMVRNGIYPIPDLKKHVRETVYFSKNAEDVFGKLKALEPQANLYWSRADKKEIRNYLSFGAFPFSLNLESEYAVYEAISFLIDRIITSDLPFLGRFDQQTLGMTKRLLLAISESDTSSLRILEEKVGLARVTVINLLEALEKAELLIKVMAYGSSMEAVRKPSKYLFMSSNIRMSFFQFTGVENTYLTRLGKLLEDSVGSHLYRDIVIRGHGSFRYDSMRGGADFIIQIGNSKQIILEVGIGKKGIVQVENTMSEKKSDYGVVFSSNPLRLHKDKNIVNIPLDYYFLM